MYKLRKSDKSFKSKNHTLFYSCCQEVLQKVFVSCWSHFQLIPPFPDKLCKDSQVYAMCTLHLVLCLVCLLSGPLEILVSYSVSNESASNLLKLLIESQTRVMGLGGSKVVVQGTVAPGYESVKDLFQANFEWVQHEQDDNGGGGDDDDDGDGGEFNRKHISKILKHIVNCHSQHWQRGECPAVRLCWRGQGGQSIVNNHWWVRWWWLRLNDVDGDNGGGNDKVVDLWGSSSSSYTADTLTNVFSR